MRALPRRDRRLPLVLSIASIITVALMAATLALVRAGADGDGRPYDALHAETLAELEVFTDWLHRHGAAGFIGEVGWPDDARGDGDEWNRLASAWYERADEAGLWAAAWAVGILFGTEYRLAVYDAEPGGLVPSTQAEVVERAAPRGVMRGVSIAGAEFGTEAPSFSNASAGAYGVAYRFDPSETFTYLAKRGHRLVRIPFRWERIQPKLGVPLDPLEVGRLRTAIAHAHAAGLAVVLDLHNYGEYRTPDRRLRLGAEIPTSAFADTWRRLAEAVRDMPGIVGYGLMNEPVHVQSGDAGSPERAWEQASQAAVSAIRATGDTRLVLVGGYPWSSVHDWPAHHPAPWIADPRGRVRYEAHHYWDTDRTGTYTAIYGEELAAAKRR